MIRLTLLFTLLAGMAVLAADAPADPPRRIPPPVNEQNRKFWSFQPAKRPEIPQVKNQAWVKSPIDAFVLAKLEAKGFAPAPPAGKTALLQRLSGLVDLDALTVTGGRLRDTLPDAEDWIDDTVIRRQRDHPVQPAEDVIFPGRRLSA